MNIVVLVAHGLNCHWLGAYGNEWVTTPAFDGLACEATIFDHHFAATPAAAGFRADVDPALRTPGRFSILVDDRRDRPAESPPWDHIVRTDPGSAATPGDALVAALRQAVSHLAGRDHWLLWIETDRLIPPWDFEYETYQHYAETTGGFTDDGAIEEEVAEPTDSPSPGPIDVTDRRLWHQLRNSFAAAVSSFDGELGRLVDVFRQAGWDRSASWFITSNYGYPLGEHGVVGPVGSRMHAELTHLPLLVRIPGDRPRRIGMFSQPADLSKLLTNPEVSITSVIHDREYICSRIEAEVAVRTEQWGLVAAAGQPTRLYVRPDDLWEVNDVAGRHPDECDHLAALIPQVPEVTT